MLKRLRRQVRQAAGELLERSGLAGEPVLRLDEAMLAERGMAQRVVEQIAASRRGLPSLLDVLSGRLPPGESVLLTVDATSAALTEALLPALASVGGAARVFVDVTRLGGEGCVEGSELAAALGYGLVTGLHVGSSQVDAAALRRRIESGRARLAAIGGAVCDAAAVSDEGHSEILRSELRRAGVTRLYTTQCGLSSASDPVQRRIELGRDLDVGRLREFLDLEPRAMAAELGRMRARRAVRRLPRR